MNAKQQIPSDFRNWIIEEIGVGIKTLVSAYRYQAFSDSKDHQYAVEIENLRQSGLDTSGIRWLMERKYIQHIIEVSLEGDSRRVFRDGGVVIGTRSCFDLTEKGIEFAESLGRAKTTVDPTVRDEANGSGITAGGSAKTDDGPAVTANGFALADIGPSVTGDVPAVPETMAPVSSNVKSHSPVWNPERQELWLDGNLVKRYRLPSPNQVAVITAFSEEGWPERIDDPLPQNGETTPKRRLQDTIRNLNRSMKTSIMKFLGDGSGEGVLWELLGNE